MEQKNKADQDGRTAELDRFWDIDALLPVRKIPPRSRNTDAEDVTVAAAPADSAAAHAEPLPPRSDGMVIHTREAPLPGTSVRRSVFPSSPQQQKPLFEYEPDSALLHHVSVWLPRSSHSYYDEFLRTARRLSMVHGAPAKPVPFFSYVPQYDQMTRAQLDWYLCLRDCIRHGVYPTTDYSYLLLLVFEVINLADAKSAANGLETLLHIWQHYRAAYVRLAAFLPEWIVDYCLIHRLPRPSLSHKERAEIMAHCALKEFYVSGGSDGYLQALLCFASNYDYRKSKFCTQENLPLYDRVIPAVLSRAMETLSGEGKLFSGVRMDDSRLQRFSYNGALCASASWRKLEISYCSFSRSHELRFLVTDIVKYTENRLRAHLGIRSRMTVYALPTEVRGILDAECDRLLPKKEPIRKPKPVTVPEYEKLYDLPRTALDPARAAEIERASWDTTQQLIDAFSEPGEAGAPSKPSPAPVQPSAPPVQEPAEKPAAEPAPQASPFAHYRSFLLAVQTGDNGKIRAAAAQSGGPPDALADEINELAVDVFGDILLEDAGDGWRVLEDYRDRLEQILSEHSGSGNRSFPSPSP